MRHLKLFEEVNSSNWESLFRKLAKLAQPITMNQFIYWNEDLVLNSNAWIQMVNFLTKNDILSRVQHDAENLAELIDIGVIEWSDLAETYNIGIMILGVESFPNSVLNDRELMNFYNYQLQDINIDSREMYYSDNDMTIVGGIINNIPICVMSMQGSYSVVFFSSNFEKYLK